jgi:hypothetical protein
MKSDYFLNKFKSIPTKSIFDDGFKNKYFSEDPVFFGFSVYFEADSPLLNPASNYLKESAERYFLNLDDDVRATYVVDLRNRLLDLVDKHQYFLQKVSGLNGFYARSEEDDIQIEIETLESLDLRITTIKELYNRITYDYINKKEILPDNLRWINMKITVSDGRKLAKWIQGDFVDITPSIGTLCFTLEKTNLDVGEGHIFLEEVLNSENEDAGSNNLKFVGGRGYIEESRLALGELLNNQKNSINTINQNNRNSTIEVELINQEKISDRRSYKKSLKEQLNDVLNEGKIALTNKAKVAADDAIRNTLNQIDLTTGLRNTNNPITSFENFFRFLERSSSTGDWSVNNRNLSEKILNKQSLTLEEKGELYKALIFAVEGL